MKKLIQTIEENYNLHAQIFTIIRESDDNNVYLIETGKQNKDKFIVRESKRVSEEDLMFEVSLLNFLIVNNVKSPRVVKTISNKNYLNFEDKFYVLFEFIEGEIFHLSSENKPSVEVAIQAGETLAALHNVLTKYQTTNKKTEICILN